jgi:hypothetical protein
MPPLLADVKTYLGLTGTADNAIITTAIASATAQAERDTGRVFSSASNQSHSYSTNGEVLVRIRDTPLTDAARVVTWNGVTLTNNSSYWLLPDRRNPDVSITIQLRPFLMSAEWYKADPNWFAKNLDNYRLGVTPLDLVITGSEGHPTWPSDVTEQVTYLAAWFYWRAKSGASGVVQTPTGVQIDIGAEPISTPSFVRNWAVRTAVGIIG